ncbi:MAG TPA: SNF2-related protein [Victivallales bacterium]|nr:SNF2-related protein [Victivallales bacterium]
MSVQLSNTLFNPDQGMLFYFSNEKNDYVFNSNSNKKDIVQNNFDLKKFNSVFLTKTERRNINNQVKEILCKNECDITKSDKNILRQYSGEGGLNSKSIGYLNQHYTSYETIKSIYNAIDKSGLKYHKALEPAAGNGNFIGLKPGLDWTTVELCNINSRILNILYPKATHYNLSYEHFTKNDFDLIISNVPFAESRGLTACHNRSDIKALHDYYFIKSLDLINDSGLIVFITSSFTMDGKSKNKIREEIINKCDLLAAFRLPNGHFKKTAHTEVQTDLIFLQKRPSKSTSHTINNKPFIQTREINPNVYLNNYYIDNPTHILGDITYKINRFGKESLYVNGNADLSLINFNLLHGSPIVKKVTKRKEIDIPNNLKEFEKWEALNKKYTIRKNYKYNMSLDGSYDQKKDSGYYEDFFPAPDPIGTTFYTLSREIKFTDVIGGAKLYEEVKGENKNKLNYLNTLLDYSNEYQQTNSLDLTNKAINTVTNYKKYFKVHPSKDKALKKLLLNSNADTFYYDISTLFLEDFSLSDVFYKKVKYQNSGIKKASLYSPLKDRALASENNKGIINISKAELLNNNEINDILSIGYAISDMVDSEIIIQNDILYYSGNIYKKIKKLQSLKNRKDNNYISILDKQISKLNSIIPEPKTLEDINFKGCEKWIRPFIKKFLNIDVKENSRNGQNEYYLSTYDSDILGSYWNKELFEKYINDRALVRREEKEAVVIYLDRLAENEEKIIDIKERLKQAIQQDSRLLKAVEYSYNSKFRSYVKPDYSKAVYLIQDVLDLIENNNPVNSKTGEKIRLRQNQKEWMCQAYYEGKGINGNDVGGGKTFAAIALAMLLKVKGVANKPLFAVPAKTIKNWEREIKILFPDSKVINLGNLPKDKRTKLLMETAKTNADYILISHEGFKELELSTENELKYFNHVVCEHIDNEGTSARSRLLLDQKIKDYRKIVINRKRDNNLTIENLGIDCIFADEAHSFKNIAVRSELVKAGLGISFNLNSTYNFETETVNVSLKSARSYDFRFKTNYIADRNNGNNVFLLTATPTPNKPIELYTMLRHLDRNIFNEYRIKSDIDFKNSFFELGIVRDIKNTENTKTILKKIINAQALNLLLNRYIDKRSIEELNIPVPEHEIINNYLDKSCYYSSIEVDLRERADNISKNGEKGKDTHIAIYTGGRNGSVDPRLYGGAHANINVNDRTYDPLDDKIEACIIDTVNSYKEAPNGGQLIFLDTAGYKQYELGLLDSDIHREIKQEIIKRTGLSSKKVVIISGQTITNPKTGNDTKAPSGEKKNSLKQQITDLYNDGDIKIIIGTSSSMGEGMNLQTKTLIIRHLDIPYTNGTIKQRNGRGVRFGNENEKVYIHCYFMKGSFDKISYDLVSKKKGWNAAIWAQNIEDEISTVEEMTGGVIPSSEQIQIELETDPIQKEKMIMEFKFKAMLEERNSIYVNLSRNKIKFERKQAYLADLNKYKQDKIIKIDSYNKFDTDKIDRVKKQLDNIQLSIKITNKQIQNIKEKIKNIESKFDTVKANIEEFNNCNRNEETGEIEITIKKAA